MDSHNDCTVKFDEKETQFLQEMLTSVPLQGNFKTLPTVLSMIAQILQKLENVGVSGSQSSDQLK